MARRDALERALANADAAGDTEAVARLQDALDAEPAPRRGDVLRGNAPQMRSAHEALLGAAPQVAAPAPAAALPESMIDEKPQTKAVDFEKEYPLMREIGTAADDILSIIDKADAGRKTRGDVPGAGLGQWAASVAPVIAGTVVGSKLGGGALGAGSLLGRAPATIAGGGAGFVFGKDLANAVSSEEGKKLRQRLATLSNTRVKLRTGAQASWQEMERIISELGSDPDKMDADTRIRLGMQRLKELATTELNRVGAFHPESAAQEKLTNKEGPADLAARISAHPDPTALPDSSLLQDLARFLDQKFPNWRGAGGGG